jgi:hypothetical protein
LRQAESIVLLAGHRTAAQNALRAASDSARQLEAAFLLADAERLAARTGL